MKPTTLLLTALLSVLSLTAQGTTVSGSKSGVGAAHLLPRQQGGASLHHLHRRNPATAKKAAPKRAAARKTTASKQTAAKANTGTGTKKGAQAGTKAKTASAKGNAGTADTGALCLLPQAGGKAGAKGRLGKRGECGLTAEPTVGTYSLGMKCSAAKKAKRMTSVFLVTDNDQFCAQDLGHRYSGAKIKEAAINGRDQWVEEQAAIQKYLKDTLNPLKNEAEKNGLKKGDPGYPKFNLQTRRYPKVFGNEIGGTGRNRLDPVISDDEIKNCPAEVTKSGWGTVWIFIEHPVLETGEVFDSKLNKNQRPESDRALFVLELATSKIKCVWLITHVSMENNAVRAGYRVPAPK